MNLFAQNVQAAHQAARDVFGGASDPQGRDLLIWWPATSTVTRRAVGTEGNFHRPLIKAMVGPARRDAVAAAALAVLPGRSMTFAAEVAAFPSGNMPRAGVFFLAGATRDEAVLYQCTGASSVAGVVEIEARVET